ncbi:hypothetical protein BFF78_08190 [Streptomyces fodineus]|uniref:Uncharacterized protein n=1 Tax=Streptomyces fodineus TaxID=1904616 RepID=A0A1D7Y614_9ACTN|nr:hypothetical protein [Streptomyces fodineus]AOR31023.1 hypothetical protein BFF78_08190 [Streptomyces fodineus]
MTPSTVRSRLRLAVSGLLGLVALCGGLAPAGAQAQRRADPTHCKIKITGKTVAVRRPQANASVARTDSQVVRYVHRGDVLRNNFCLIALGRTNSGPLYRECGEDGYD